jgi:hypothetical protein
LIIDRERRARDNGSDQDHEESDRLEEQSKSLHASGAEVTRLSARPAQQQVDCVHRDPQHRSEGPASEPPARDEEDGQREEHDHAARERRKDMPRLGPRRRKQGCAHQNAPRYLR